MGRKWMRNINLSTKFFFLYGNPRNHHDLQDKDFPSLPPSLHHGRPHDWIYPSPHSCARRQSPLTQTLLNYLQVAWIPVYLIWYLNNVLHTCIFTYFNQLFYPTLCHVHQIIDDAAVHSCSLDGRFTIELQDCEQNWVSSRVPSLPSLPDKRKDWV